MNLSYQEHWTFWGHPTEDHPVFGLYEPVNDTFFIVNKHLEVLQEVALLYSSRFTLYVCNLTPSASAVYPIIDNTNCFNWTVGNKQSFAVTRFLDPTVIFTVNELVPTSAPLVQDFKHDQQYLIAACFWLGEAIPRIASTLKSNSSAAKALNRVAEVVGAPYPNPVLEAINEIKEIIYTEFNYNLAKMRIDQLLAPYYG